VEYFDVTTEFMGLGKEYTAQLTKEQIEELDVFFDSIGDSLNKSVSIEESVEIFREVVLKLDWFGLLGDVGIEKTEKLVTNCYKEPIWMKVLERLYNRRNAPLDEDENRFCLIFGITSGLLFINPSYLTLNLIFLKYLTEHSDLDIYTLAFLTIILIWVIPLIIPFCLGRMICINFDWAFGTIVTFGLNGLKYWTGNLKGKMNFDLLEILAFGFTGLKIEVLNIPKQYFFGFASRVHIEDS
jgi:hypothetical protein